ncbi:S9 family peptidase [Novosphingobium cyanobacteriorum]|uniref:DPP IV N-terminal domain-containing protein n=1 Tax=Novosphingobium cyanobacteriorum TaxID=3024215 RepID=A0ABT6CLZ7_9SPHN|nr:S9 family peptidase [Novosphingobium cyanobacteriorum]MDF8334831.1 DPP IV N-terminal domain-containing protein [Novosphingobium cyanobacteriorum]
MRLLSRLLVASAFVLASPALAAPAGNPPVTARAPEPAPALTLQRVFASPSLNGPAPMGVKLSPDGRTLSLLRNRADDAERYDLWGYDRQSGQWRMLVDSLKLSSGRALSEAEKMQRERKRIGNLKGVVSYEWAPDGKSVLVPLDGDLFLAGLDGSVQPIAGANGGVLNPALSPKGGKLAFVRDGRVYVVPVAGGAQPLAITPAETSHTVHWGEAEFVAQEEMDRMNGFWWSPAADRLAVERFDEAQVGVVTRAAIGADGTKTFDQRYPAAGTPNADVSLWVIGADGQGRVQVDLGADKDIYLVRVDWAPDGKTLYVQRENRAQTRLDMLAVDPATGASRVLFTENAAEKSWINLSSNYRFLKDGSLLWWSERDGYGHLYHFKDGGWTQLTSGPWMVTGLVGVDQKAGRVTFTATRDGVLEGQVYALDIAHPGKIERLTETGFDNAATMDAAGQTLLVSRSADTQPPQSYLADAHGKRIAWIEQNRVVGSHPYAPYVASHRPAQFGTIKSPDGKTDLHWVMITPPLEAGRQYPVFTYHYGGPHSRVVHGGWQGALAQAVVDKGYIWFAIDNRGSSDRGVAFESTIWRAMGSVEVEDQLAGVNYLRTLPYVDPKRISTFGWSYGGYMTIKMLEAHPGAWNAGIAVAPVTKWELYDTHYTERYLGDPRTEPQVYTKSGALADTAKIADPLLIVHGMADDNVVFENTSAIVAKLQGEAVPFEMMLYPGFTHRISGPKVSQHLYETMFRFLDRNGVGTGQ